MRFRKSHDVAVDEENPYWMSFSDIMSALLVIFILASVILILQLMDIQQKLEERQVQFEQEIEELKRRSKCAAPSSMRQLRHYAGAASRWRSARITRC